MNYGQSHQAWHLVRHRPYKRFPNLNCVFHIPPNLAIMRKSLFKPFLALSFVSFGRARVTLYNQYGQFTLGSGDSTSTAIQAEYTDGGIGPYDPLVIDPPPLPDSRPASSFKIQIYDYEVPGLSHTLEGNFFGFSIEFSVVTQVSKYDSILFLCMFLYLNILSQNFQ